MQVGVEAKQCLKGSGPAARKMPCQPKSWSASLAPPTMIIINNNHKRNKQNKNSDGSLTSSSRRTDGGKKRVTTKHTLFSLTNKQVFFSFAHTTDVQFSLIHDVITDLYRTALRFPKLENKQVMSNLSLIIFSSFEFPATDERPMRHFNQVYVQIPDGKDAPNTLCLFRGVKEVSIHVTQESTKYRTNN